MNARARPLLVMQAIKPKRLYQRIAEQIHGLLRAFALKPGDRLPSEIALARQLGVSRPSVREALIVLETAGLIEVFTGSGSYVREPPPGRRGLPWEDAADPGPGPLGQFRARLLLECELAAEAALRITAAELAGLEAIVARIERAVAETARVGPDHFLFHERLAEASGNSVLAAFVRDLLAMNRGPLWQTIRGRADTAAALGEGVAFRKRLIEILRRRDARGARAAMRQHLERIGRIYFGERLDRLRHPAAAPAATATRKTGGRR